MFDVSRGQKTLFFKKGPNNGLVSEKKYIGVFFTVGEGGGGSDQSVKNFTFFFKASLYPGPCLGLITSKCCQVLRDL